MKAHLTTEDVYDLAYDKLDVSNIKVDKEMELAQMLDLEWDESVNAYKNPDFVISEYMGVPWCAKCDPVQAGNTKAGFASGKSLCKCGNSYEK